MFLSLYWTERAISEYIFETYLGKATCTSVALMVGSRQPRDSIEIEGYLGTRVAKASAPSTVCSPEQALSTFIPLLVENAEARLCDNVF